MDKQEFVIMGIFYDGYMDSWVDFLNCFKHFWPKCPYSLYIITNEKKLEGYDNVIWIQAGRDAEFSRKVQVALEKIDAKYYLLMLEDFYIGGYLEDNILEPVLRFIKKEDLDNYVLAQLSLFTKYKSKPYKKELDYLLRLNPAKRYTLSCQASIWKKDFLKRCIGTLNYNAWVFEGAVVRSRTTHSEEFLEKCVYDTRNILKLKHGILQQKRIPTTVNHFERIGNPLSSTRLIMTKKEYNRFVQSSILLSLMPKWLHTFLRAIYKKPKDSVLAKYDQEIAQVVQDNFGD